MIDTSALRGDAVVFFVILIRRAACPLTPVAVRISHHSGLDDTAVHFPAAVKVSESISPSSSATISLDQLISLMPVPSSRSSSSLHPIARRRIAPIVSTLIKFLILFPYGAFAFLNVDDFHSGNLDGFLHWRDAACSLSLCFVFWSENE